MPILITPESDIPLPVDTKPEELEGFRERALAMFNTVEELQKQGGVVEESEEAKVEARTAFLSSKALPSTANPASIRHLNSILNEWDQEVLDVGRRLRNYVTNKLLIESTDADPKVRLKSLELLGKLSNVGAFSERVDVTVTHRTINDIENELKKTLELYTGEVIDVATESPVATLSNLDIDKEFGTEPPPQEDSDES